MGELFLRVFGPVIPAALTLIVLDAVEYRDPTVGLFLALWAIWLILLNGGFLILDDL
jgi:hypothetical protein